MGQQLLSDLCNFESLASKGFDLVQFFNTSVYNDWIENAGQKLIPIQSESAACLVGASKLFWPIFKSNIPMSNNPVDDYCSKEIPKHFKRVSDIYFPTETGGRLVHFCKVAELSGLAYFNQEAFLCIHPVVGPWFAMRAILVFDPAIAYETQPSPVQNPFPQADALVREKMKEIAGKHHKEITYKLIEMRRILGSFAGEYEYSEEEIEYYYFENKDSLV